jgi:hypothetical protein
VERVVLQQLMAGIVLRQHLLTLLLVQTTTHTVCVIINPAGSSLFHKHQHAIVYLVESMCMCLKGPIVSVLKVEYTFGKVQ